MNRLHFIIKTSAGLTGFAMGSRLVKPTRSRNKSSSKTLSLKKGYMLGTFPNRDEYSILEKFKMLKEAGFQGVEPDSGLEREEILKASEETGLELPSVVCSTHWSSPLSSPDPAVRRAGLDGMKIALQDAYKYGSKCVLLVPGRVTEKVSYDMVYRRSQAEIKKLVPMAEDLGITIAIENVWNQFLLSPMEAARYVDEFESPSIGWYFDIGNILNYGWPQHWIRILGERIAMIHIKEYSLEKRDSYGPFAGFRINYLDGDNNWPEIMQALRDIGYNGEYGIAEPAYRDDTIEDEIWLKEHVSEPMDKIFSM